MSVTKEYRNLGAIEDAVASVGATIQVAESLYEALVHVLPDDSPDVRLALEYLREAQLRAEAILGV